MLLVMVASSGGVSKRPRFVGSNRPAVADDFGSSDRCKPLLLVLPFHGRFSTLLGLFVNRSLVNAAQGV